MDQVFVISYIEIPQIQCYENLQYAIDKLNLDMSDLQASEHITK